MKKILTLSVITVAVLSLCGIVAVNAQTEGGNGPFSIIIQKLVERFNLNAEEVQEVFDEVRDEMRQEMQARFEERIGDKTPEFTPPEFTPLTDEQKEALSAKREELQEKFEALKDLSQEERQAKMEELREEMEAWAEEQGIDLRFIGGIFGPGFRGSQRGFGRGLGSGFFGQEP